MRSTCRPSLTWDGKADSGTMAPEGAYTAKLSIDYASKYQSVSLESKSFVLDINPPTGQSAWTRPSSPRRTTGSRGR